MLMRVRKKCDITNGKDFTTSCTENADSQINPLRSNHTNWSDTLKQSVGNSRRIV